MDIPYLTHANLVLEPGEQRPSAHYYGRLPHEVLIPLEIPVHPYVTRADFFRQRDFSQQVLVELPRMVQEDIEVIADKIGVRLELKATEEGMYAGSRGFEFAKVRLHRPGISVGETSVVFNRNGSRIRELPDEISGAYEDDLGQHFRWGVNNFSWKGIGFELYARNYAIAVNNEGLKRLEPTKPHQAP
jgi:hypothetical protein